MSVTRLCKHCGAVLPAGARLRLCPKCLLGQAVRASVELAPVGRAVPSAPETQRRARQAGDSPPYHPFGDYELIEKIATGGMGVVYKARQLRLNRIVALKMIPPGRLASEESVWRFQAEAEAAASLQHPHIVAIHETGECEGQHYFSMDYVAGQNLADAVRSQPLPPIRAAQVLKAIAEAVHYAHQKGILHRDLKPSNIILDEAGEPRVTDFGLAKRLTSDSQLSALNHQLTLTGQVIGSPGFMPPEQAAGQTSQVDVRSDVYGLGAILYYVLTGRPPFQAATITDVLKQLAEAEPVPPRLLNPSVPHDLATICLKCLEKDMPRRYPSAQALAEELGRFLRGEPIHACPIGLAGKAGRWCRRNPRLAAVTGVALLSVVIGITGILWQWRRATQSAQAELRQRQRAVAGELSARQNAYASDAKLAQLALLDNNVGLAKTLLDKHRPVGKSKIQNPKSEVASRHSSLATDLRHWEWRYLWQLCQGDESVLLHQYLKPIRTVAVSEDGKLLAVLNRGGQVALWDLTLRRPLRVVTDAATKALACSRSGRLLAFSRSEASRDQAVEVWDVPAGKLRTSLPQSSSIGALAFSPDETLLAVYERAGRVVVVEMPSNPILTNTITPTRRTGVGVVAFSPDGSRLAVGEDFGGLQVLDCRSGTALRIQTQTDEGVTALAFSPGDELVAVGFGSSNGGIRLWDPRSGEARGQLTNHASGITALAFSPNGRLLAASDNTWVIRVWRVPNQTELCCLRAYRGGARALAFLPDGKTLLSGGNDGAVRLWDVTAPRRIPGHTNLVISYGFPSRAQVEPQDFARGALDPRVVCRFGFTFAPDGQSFLMPDKDGFIDVWELGPVRRTERLTILGSNHWDVALSPDGRWLAAGETIGRVTVWDWTAHRPVANFALPFEWFGRLRFSRSGRFLLAGAVLGNYNVNWHIWRTGDWQEVPLPATLLEGLFWADLSPDERLLGGGYANGAVKLWHFPAGLPEAAFTNHSARVNGVLFSPEGRTLFSTSDDGQVRFWDVAAQRELGPFPGLTGVYGIGASSDGRRLVTGTGGVKDPVKLWDLATHRELLSLQGKGQYFVGFGFSPDGNTLIGTTLSGVANLWRVPSWAEIEEAEPQSKTVER